MRPGHSRGRIHIVDDDPSFATATARRLKHAGYDVATYASAQQLLDRLPTGNEPSCIILDVRMPGLDGPALQKRLGELGSTLPIIFLTGYGDTPTIVRTIKSGAHDFLSKPVNSDGLLQANERAPHRQRVMEKMQASSSGRVDGRGSPRAKCRSAGRLEARVLVGAIVGGVVCTLSA